jgi:hypothetical protein
VLLAWIIWLLLVVVVEEVGNTEVVQVLEDLGQELLFQ